ncbi:MULTISPECIES: RSP_7527 family protein [Marinobacter]|uniref:RSP_7527 family protein n=1 Tax=Marinobacter TaxID=2742 RepID=UPI0013A6DE6D|nr:MULTISPECIES: hypothetical protein [Marinobacter]
MSEHDVKIDAYGNIDVDHYIRQAHKERSEYVAKLGSSLKAKIKSVFRVEPSKLSPSH